MRINISKNKMLESTYKLDETVKPSLFSKRKRKLEFYLYLQYATHLEANWLE